MRAALAVVAALALVVGLVGAEERSTAELDRIRAQARELEERLRDVESRQRQKGQERQDLERQLALEVLRVRECEEELKQMSEREQDAVRAADVSKVEHEAAVQRLKTQLSVMAMLGRPGLAPLVIHAVGSGEDVAGRVTTVLALVRQQEAQRRELAAAVEARNAALAELSRRQAEVEEGAAKLAVRRRTLEDTRRRVLAELARLEIERRDGALELATTRESEARLERLWGVVATEKDGEVADARFLRGGLPWPVDDVRVVRSFGPRRDPRYGTVTVSHGLGIACASGRSVRAVASGRVSYAQFFKGYGNVVILDHGHGVYSLYGRLASILVRSGARASMGDAVGITGTPGEDEGNLYVEIRIGDKPQNPVAWLRPLGKRGTT